MSYKIHFLLHFTVQSRNGSMLLCQIREENTTLKNNHLKKFWIVHESHTYQASSPFQFASNAVKRSMLSSLPASHVVLRGSALMIISLGHCHFQWSATVLLILKALIPFAKVLEPPLHCMFVSSSWAKCIVAAASCSCCFTTHFVLK